MILMLQILASFLCTSRLTMKLNSPYICHKFACKLLSTQHKWTVTPQYINENQRWI